RLDRAPDDRRRPRRALASLVGGHRVPARRDDHRSALRQARRPLRPQADPPVRDRHLPRRLRALRAQPEHDRADRLPPVPAAALSAIVLFTSLGGTTYAWGSTQILVLIALSILLLPAFVFVESRASEPILPLALFRNRTFAVTSAVGFIVGLALFGAVTYLPL